MSNGKDTKVGDDFKVGNDDIFIDRARDPGQNWKGAVQDGRNDQTPSGTMIYFIYLAQEASPGVGAPTVPSWPSNP
jgi:hypothetical protein